MRTSGHSWPVWVCVSYYYKHDAPNKKDKQLSAGVSASTLRCLCCRYKTLITTYTFLEIAYFELKTCSSGICWVFYIVISTVLNRLKGLEVTFAVNWLCNSMI